MAQAAEPMPLLLYCIADEHVAPPGVVGVRGRPVHTLSEAGLQCFFSPGESLSHPSSEQLRNDALDFHHVVSDVFSRAAVIPFRFPTFIEDAAELELLLQRNGPEYREALITHREHAQMEMRLSPPAPPAEEAGGKQYLEQRRASARLLEATAQAAKTQLAGIVLDWRQRPAGEGLRCFALVRRESVAECRDRLRAQPAPEGVKIVVSGPWPVTEFLDALTHG